MKRLCAFLLALLLVLPAARADELPSQVIHDVLLSTVSEEIGDFGAAGWAVVGEELKGRERYLYLAASVGRYGVMGGRCVMLSGWSGPCTVVFRQVNGEWTFADLLKIEDYSEIPAIMPRNIEKKFLNGQYDADGLERMLNAGIDRLRGDVPRGDYAAAGGELPGVYILAGNLLTAFDGDGWPTGCTTLERTEDGTRVIYAKSWRADEGAQPIVTRAIVNGNAVPHAWGGTAGTVTLTKTRAADGYVLQTVAAHADETGMTIDLLDDFGSMRYEMAVVTGADGFPAFAQPAVTHEGACRINTEYLERCLRELPGERKAEWEIEARAQASDTERFTLLRDSCYRLLRHETLTDGAWREDWVNSRIIGDCCDVFRMDFLPGTGEKQAGRFAYAAADTLRISAGEESPTVWIELSRRGGEWLVETYENRYFREFAYLLDDCMLVQDHALAADQRALFVPGAVERRAAFFDPQVIGDAHETLTNLYRDFDPARRERYVDLGLTVDYADIAGAEPLYASLGMDQNVPVYAYPAANAPRAANGRAAVSLNGPVAFLCRENGWLMVLYETGTGGHRTGWISADADPILARIAALTLPARFSRRQAQVIRETALTDDPISGGGVLCPLKKGAEITVLSDGAALYYAEARVNGKTWRGYVESGCLAVK